MPLLKLEEIDPRTSVLDAVQVEVLAALIPHMEEVRFAAGETIFAAGSPPDAFYIVDQGEVRVEVPHEELDTESVLEYVGTGSFLGDMEVLGATNHGVTAVAQTDVEAHKVSRAGLRRLFDENPAEGIKVLRALARNTALRLESAVHLLAEHAAEDSRDPEVDRIVAAAQAAQAEFQTWSEERVDALLKDIAEAVASRADELGAAELEETHIGNAADKALKLQFAAMAVYAALEGEVGFGLLDSDDVRRVSEMASPVGVVIGLVPLTNPGPTFVNKTLICLKARNALILSCHRGAQKTGNAFGELIQEVLVRHGAPVDVVQWIRNRTSRKKTARFMRHEGVGMILATGGPAMVKAAYSSGKPAIGVGAGNAPAWVAPDADIEATAEAVITSKGFDNGLICGSEQHLVVDRGVEEQMVDALQRQGAVVLDADQTKQFMATAFEENGDLRMWFVGQSPSTIGGAIGMEIPPETRLIVFRADASSPEGAFARERLAPVMSLFTVDGDEEAIALCRKLLDYEGAGHTANVHTQDEERVRRFAEAMPVSRVLVNTPSAMGCCGVVTGLAPSLTLGCGTFGGNSTTDNVGYRNLLNIKRVARSLA
ncbi:MAG TPA: aldehyde dehydrogenase family protein [Solirubrobacteraceae bacterium]|nr:aldehyde dehydrogenase family protein [Solirubrobacteraceae bacterium]